MLKTLLLAASLWFAVHWAFVAVMHAKAVQERAALSLYWKVMLAPLAVAGLVLDLMFNLTFGTIMYRELPREFLFTSRCQRHYGTGGYRGRMAAWWARQLNAFDPDHIHEPRS